MALEIVSDLERIPCHVCGKRYYRLKYIKHPNDEYKTAEVCSDECKDAFYEDSNSAMYIDESPSLFSIGVMFTILVLFICKVWGIW